MHDTDKSRTWPASLGPELATDWFVLADAGGAVPPLTDFALAAKALRDLLLAAWDGPIPEIVSGHAGDGAPSRWPHAAMLPLAFVGPSLADGRLLGLAVVLPRATAQISVERDAARQRIQDILAPATGAPVEIRLGARGVWAIEPRRAPYGFSLDPARYLAQSATWASLTPIVLDRFPKAGLSKERIVTEACERIGLPTPDDVRLDRASAIAGAPPTQTAGLPWGDGGWTLPPRRDGSRHPFADRMSTHAVIRFPEPVAGPLVLGAGRFMGLGLCLPVGANRDR